MLKPHQWDHRTFVCERCGTTLWESACRDGDSCSLYRRLTFRLRRWFAEAFPPCPVEPFWLAHWTRGK